MNLRITREAEDDIQRIAVFYEEGEGGLGSPSMLI